jgi:hypothetical protein
MYKTINEKYLLKTIREEVMLMLKEENPQKWKVEDLSIDDRTPAQKAADAKSAKQRASRFKVRVDLRKASDAAKQAPIDAARAAGIKSRDAWKIKKIKIAKALKALGPAVAIGLTTYGVYKAIKTAKTPIEAANMIGWQGLYAIPILAQVLLGYEGQKIASQKDFEAAMAAASNKTAVSDQQAAALKSFTRGGKM